MAGFGANLMQMLNQAIQLGGMMAGGNAPQAYNGTAGQQLPTSYTTDIAGGNLTNITGNATGQNTPVIDATGRITQPQAPQAQGGIVESALQNANAPALAPQLAAAREGAQLQINNPQLSQTQVQSQIGMPAELQQSQSSLSGSGISSPETANYTEKPMADNSMLNTILQTLSGGSPNMSAEQMKDWQRWQAIGALGTRLGGAIAGENTPVGNASEALSNTFSGNLSAKNTETQAANMNNYLKSAYENLTGGAGKSVGDAGIKSGAYQGVASSLAGQQIATPSFTDIRDRLNRIGK